VSGQSSLGGSASSKRAWRVLLLLVFATCSGLLAVQSVVDTAGVGSHAVIYTEAARAWLAGGDPWTVGDPGQIFAGPPPMLVPFLPFVLLPNDLVRLLWIGGSVVLAIWVLRQLGLPGYWLGFPPIFQAIQLGHPEILVLWLLVIGGLPSGLAVLIKPYAAFPLIAERRWKAIALAAGLLVLTAAVLPWTRFVNELPLISATIANQTHGDSVFGQPALMIVAVIALASLGWRRAFWLATPLLWPAAQPMYKVVSVPALSPLLALFWSIPIPGVTLVGLVVEALLHRLGATRELPAWLRSGLEPIPLDDGLAFGPGARRSGKFQVGAPSVLVEVDR
jgi:hypothetical protein